MIISSKANPTVKHIVSLTEKKFRREYGEYLVEGVKALNECIKAGDDIVDVVCTQNFQGVFGGNEIVVTDELFLRISTEKSPQGVIASVKMPDVAVKTPKGNCLLLDRVQDPGNIGTIIRTANAAGYQSVYLVNCADPFSPKAVRASMGGIFYVDVYVGSYDEVFSALKGYKIITADMSGEGVFDFTPPEKYCLCIGNEGNGIGDEVSKKSDYTVRVPMRETCESLNAAVSAAIVMYALKNNR